MRKALRVWQRAQEMLDSHQMPPKKAAQPSDAERNALRKWVHEFLTIEAAASAGDPGPVVLRRLDNAEYTYTLCDLTGVASLDPAREFPVDSAAGEGFTNTGNALVMSPAFVTKYLDAAKEIASHAVLYPGGFRFSSKTTRRDWTEELLARIRDFYGQFTEAGGGSHVNLQGIQFDTNQGGRLPVEKYLAATLSERRDLLSGEATVKAVAHDRGLNPKYLRTLWQVLSEEPARHRSLLIDEIRAKWKTARPEDVPAIAAEIERWQKALWKFNSIGSVGRRFGRKDGPESWMEPVTPIVARQDVRLKLTAAPGQKEITLYLAASPAGDGHEQDIVVWENPRIVAPGRPDLPLRDLRKLVAELAERREQVCASVAKCLAAAAEVGDSADKVTTATLAERHGVDPALLAAWLEHLGLSAGEARIDSLITQKSEKSEAYDFIKGWVGADALGVLANSSDQHVRIPGNMKPHSVAVHPSPSRSVIIGWRSPVTNTVAIAGAIQHAHPECGNGVTWSLEHRRGRTRQRLAGGVAQGAKAVTIPPISNIAVRKGDLVAVVIGPRDGNHSCDLTAVDVTLKSADCKWDLAHDVAPDILNANPHGDSFGNRGIWSFASEPDRGGTDRTIPVGSLLARWLSAPTAAERTKVASELQELLSGGGMNIAKDSPDGLLYHQLTSLSGPLLSAVRNSAPAEAHEVANAEPIYGIDPAHFGKHPQGAALDERSLCVHAPSTIVAKLPADLVEGCEFVTTGALDPASRSEGSVQLRVQTTPPETTPLSPAIPVVAAEKSAARGRFETAFDDMRQLFPPALCYARIVPVDEVITLNLFFREDDQLRRLMLDDRQAAELDRLWDELIYVSQEPLLLAAAFEQLSEFATQDRPDIVNAFTPMRGPIKDYAANYRQRLVDTEPAHLKALLAFAAKAYRRPLGQKDSRQLMELYNTLRKQDIPHDEAFRLMLSRVLVAPAFLYRIEEPGTAAEQHPVSSYELASRLSYFLWSSMPDEELMRAASTNQLQNPDVLFAQMRRMVADPKTRRLATEFAAQWLHIHSFDSFDEKSERHFPTFAKLRGAMYEESVQFLTDMFQNDRSILNILDADYTFLNEDLANHYGIPGVKGQNWRRVEGVRQHQRGGILTQATTLAKQAGASRTSPILRGNWLSEVILGEKLPRPPKNVPQLPETAPQGLTERQLIEKHSSDPACAKCHVRIDPMGFALENYDAIGRYRQNDAGGLPIDAQAQLQNGTKLNGVDGLRSYLRNDRRDAFVRQFNRKLLGYSLGRSIQLSDEPLLAEMEASLKKYDYRVSTVLDAIVRSRQFREIRGRSQADAE
jgi:hypothetical protein